MPASGYIYTIRDPRIPKPYNIIFVGNSDVPWVAVERHLRRSSNPRVAEWATKLIADFPEGLRMHGQIVADRWHGENIDLPESYDGRTLLEWDIVDFEEEQLPSDDHAFHTIGRGSKKAYWIKKLQDEGHPLLNNVAGRPRKQAKTS